MNPLTTLTFLPLLGALVILFLPSAKTGLLRGVALGFTALVGLLGIQLFATFDGAAAGPQLETIAPWFTLPGTEIPVHYHLAVDGISLLLVVLTSVIMPIVLLSTPGHVKTRVKEFLVWMLVMETAMLGVFLAWDLVLFYVFWEVSLIPLYFIVGIWGGSERLAAAIKFFLYTVAGSLVMLVAAIALIYATGTTDIGDLIARTGALAPGTQAWIFLAFALAFAIKVPVLPFHTWLPDAHTEAPTSGSVILAGVLLKMGTYGLLRFGLQIFPDASVQYAGLFMGLGAAGIVYGALLAMAQTDMKRLIACSSVSHLGFCVLGLFALTPAGVRGSLLQMVNHGLSTGLLFLLIGMIYERRHTRAIDGYGGIAARMPLFALFFVFSVLSSAGLPGLNGFVGEYLILLGSFQASPLLAAISVSGVVLGAVYLLSLTRRLLFGPITHPENETLTDLTPREIGLMMPLVVLCFWIGIRSETFLDPTEATLDRVVERLEGARQAQLDAASSPHETPRVALSAEEGR